MSQRFDRVRLSARYLAKKEEEELLEVAQRTGPFQEALIPQVVAQVEEEMDGIRRKGGMRY